jgi:BirA family transcriptional regulator, biotin operon repressor / biotin---[acetyl-CoA-carboxylase] ligase
MFFTKNLKLNTKCIGHCLYHFSQIESTNRYILEHYRSLREGSVVIADYQTRGRGRLGRKWKSSMGKGLLFSVLLKPDKSPDNLAFFTQVAGVALLNTLQPLTTLSYTIKWPNDIYINNKKISGILCESIIENNETQALIVGIGLNINHEKTDFIDDLQDKATSLFIETNQKWNPTPILSNLLTNLEQGYQNFLSNNTHSMVKKINDHFYLKDKQIFWKGNIYKVVELNPDGSLSVTDSASHNQIAIQSGEIIEAAE